jgi:hypothetical protein
MKQKIDPRPGDASRSGYFAQRSVRSGELPSIMRKHIFTGTLGSVWGNLVTGIIYVYFGNAVGMTQFQWGLLGGITSWVVVMQPLGAIIGERASSRKLVWVWSALSDRVVRMLGVIGAYLLYRAGFHGAYLVFMACICLACVPGNLANGPWYGWLATIIPPEVQGSFWGRRDSWISLVVILVALPSGLVMDLMPEGGKLETAMIVLVAASLVGFIDIVIHGTIPEPPHARSGSRLSLSGMLSPLKDRRFRPWLVFATCWNFSVALAGTLAPLYFMSNLGFKDNLLVGMISTLIISLAGTFIAGRKVGRMVDRYGTKRMLMLSHFFWAFIPLIWLFATPATAFVFVGAASLIGGVFINAAGNASIKLVTRFSASEESGMYMAVSTTVSSFAAGLGSVVAGAFLGLAGSWSFPVLGLVVSAFPLLFVVSGALRFIVIFTCIPRIKATGARPEEERPFLLPLFFEGVPGISRFTRPRKGRNPRQ